MPLDLFLWSYKPLHSFPSQKDKTLSDPKSASSYRPIKFPPHSTILMATPKVINEFWIAKFYHFLNTTDLTSSFINQHEDFQLNLDNLRLPLEIHSHMSSSLSLNCGCVSESIRILKGNALPFH